MTLEDERAGSCWRIIVATKSAIGWLDLGEEDQARARDYLAGFRTEGTVDELGFGIMRDALADEFFPATNTIMTRARYLLFIPALYLIVEHERLDGNRAADRMTDLENQLREALDRPGVEGVIGRRAKEDLDRFPSNVYWSAIKQLGISLRPRWSQNYYHDHLKQFYLDSAAAKDDDGLAHLAAGPVRNWDKRFTDFVLDGQSLFVRGLQLPETVDFDLTPQEAQYLLDRFKAIAGDEPSLLLHLITLGYRGMFDYPWDVPCPDRLRRTVAHAQRLSMLAKGATLMYYHMLVDARLAAGLAAPSYDLLQPFSLWWKEVRDTLSKWDLNDFFLLMHSLDAVRVRDREFFDHFLTAFRASESASDLLQGKACRGLVCGRERTKRPKKARLAGGDHLRSWQPPESLDTPAFSDSVHVRYWLDYRSAIGKTFVHEIVQGIRRTS